MSPLTFLAWFSHWNKKKRRVYPDCTWMVKKNLPLATGQLRIIYSRSTDIIILHVCKL